MYCSSDLILITACRHVVAKGQLKSMSEDACVDTFGGGNNGDQVTFQLNNMMVRHHLHNISICRLGRTRATGRGHTWRPSASFCPGATRFACACVENIPEPCVTRVRSANDYDMCVDRANSRNVHIWGCHSGEASHHITSHHITSHHTITSHHITITSHHITSYQTPTGGGNQFWQYNEAKAQVQDDTGTYCLEVKREPFQGCVPRGVL